MPDHLIDSPVSPQVSRFARVGRKNQRLPSTGFDTTSLIGWLALIAAVSCVGGGIELMLWPRGNPYLPPLDALSHTPFVSFFVPGVILVCVGCAALACVLAVLRGARVATDLALLAGGALSAWMIAEIAILRVLDALSLVYTSIGLLLLVLGARSAWRSRHPRYRWWIVVTLAEACGFIAPAATGIFTASANIEGGAQALLLVFGGIVEGLVLGAGQAWAFPLPLRKARYIFYTGLSAGFAWGCAMSVVALAAAPDVPRAVPIIVGSIAGVASLCAMGAGQWLELRRHTPHAARWITWTALAWLLALPFSFAPGPFVDESTAVSSQIALWGLGGMLMACTMALVTWHGVRRIMSSAAD